MSLRFVALMLLALGSISDVHADDTIEPATELDAASQAAISRTQEWWTAFAMNDAAYLRARTASEMTLTLANGGTFDRAGLPAQSATFLTGAAMKMEWPTQSVRFATPDLAIVHGRLDERVGPNGSIYRVLTVLERRNGQWTVVGHHCADHARADRSAAHSARRRWCNRRPRRQLPSRPCTAGCR